MSDERPLAVVLASGGMDSCVVLALAARDYRVAALHASYGQRTAARELKAFNDLADFFEVPADRRLVVDLSHLARIGGSALTDASQPIPEGKPSTEGIPATYVPFRNANLLSIATAWAEVLGAEKIFFGAMEQDSSGYPDCRRVFVEAFNRLIAAGTRPETSVQVVAPLLHLSKGEVVRLGLKLRAPFHLTWSCYQSEEVACGRCESCLLRLKGFREAGATDPIPYATTRPSRGG